MADNIIAEIRQLLQDIVAPDLKSIIVRIEGLQRQMELSQKAIELSSKPFALSR